MTPDDVKQFCIENAVPIGYRYSLVVISITKRALAADIPSEFRMKFLEHLDKLTIPTDGFWLTPDMISVVAPMCDHGDELVREARALDRHKVLDAYSKFFPAFASLNPSLIAALEMLPGCRERIARAEATA
jgi:hypothetical protein